MDDSDEDVSNQNRNSDKIEVKKQSDTAMDQLKTVVTKVYYNVVSSKLSQGGKYCREKIVLK